MENHIRQLFNDDILSKASLLFATSITDVKSIGGFENFIYEYQKDGNYYILRITHSDHRSLELMDAELDFVNYLAENGAKVSRPVLSVNNHLIEKVECDNGSYFIVSSFEKAKGNHAKKENANEILFENYGRVIGQMHRLTKSYDDTHLSEKRYVWYDDLLIKDARNYLPKEEYIIADKLEQLIDKIKQLPKNKDNYGLIHTDVHMGNFFVDNNNITVFDFDDCAYHYFVSDIAIALFYFTAFVSNADDAKARADYLMTPFMKGYLAENYLDFNSYSMINYFVKLREFIIFIVFYRSCDLNENQFAKNYIEKHRERLINDVDLLDIDLNKYYPQ